MRSKSLLINFLLTSVSLPHGDDARSPHRAAHGAMTTTRPPSKPKVMNPLFPVAEAVIFERDASPVKKRWWHPQS
jgi:hypothetical protein